MADTNAIDADAQFAFAAASTNPPLVAFENTRDALSSICDDGELMKMSPAADNT
jgi:hypothetical protein